MSTPTTASDPAPATDDRTPLLEAVGLTRHFSIGGAGGLWGQLTGRRRLHAVDDASFTIGRGEILALVGESGSGKSTIARLLARVHEPTSGQILFEGKDTAEIRGRAADLAYRSDVPMVFQDPFSSLNPSHPVSHGILRGLALHRPDIPADRRRAEALAVMEQVGLSPAESIIDRYPYELSGGQRQRIGFAQALAYRPKLIVADEPVSMLDVSIRIGLLNVMARLRDEQGVSLLYITHDIASARYVADRIMVMYAGQVVETGPVEQVLADPLHPYTQLLLSAVPDPRAPLTMTAADAAGEPPKVIDPTPGCRFRDRCPVAEPVCGRSNPALIELLPEHRAACFVAAREHGKEQTEAVASAG